MMQKTQKGVAKWVVRILLVLLILSFGLWGISDYLGTSSTASVATVGDREITQPEFINEAQRRLNILSQQQNRPIDPELAIRLGLYNQILSGMVDNAALAEEADDLGLAVSDDAVASEIRNDPTFAGTTGKFDRLRFEETLNRAGFSEARYVESLRQDLINRQLESSVTAGLQEGPAALARAILAWQLETRDLEILQIPNKALATAPEPDEAELRAFHDENSQAFTAPELRSARIILVRPEDIADQIEVTDQEVEEAYESRIAEFSRPASRTVKQAIFQDEQSAQAVLDSVNEGVAFDKAVEDATGSAPIDVGQVSEGELPGAVGQAAFSAGAGEVAGPVQSDFGWHLVHVVAAEEEETQPLSEVRESVERHLKLDRAIGDLVELANRLEDELATGARAAEVADTLSLKLIELPPVTRQGLTLDGQNPAENLPRAALEELFAAEPGDDLAAQELDDGALLVVETTEVLEPALQPFEDVRDEVAAAWRRKQLREGATEARQKLEERLAGGASLADIAGEFDADVETVAGVTRQAGAPSVGGSVRDAVFELEAGKSTGGDAASGSAQILVTVTKVTPVDVGENDEQAQGLAGVIGEAFSEDIRQIYLQTLRDEHGVGVNQRAYRDAVDPNGIYLDR